MRRYAGRKLCDHSEMQCASSMQQNEMSGVALCRTSVWNLSNEEGEEGGGGCAVCSVQVVELAVRVLSILRSLGSP